MTENFYYPISPLDIGPTVIDHNEDGATTEYHLPFHNFAGPGTHIIERLEKGVKPTTDLDLAALIHDVEYLGLDQHTADRNFRKNLIRQSIFNFPLANFTSVAFTLKDLVGYPVEHDEQAYKYAKKLAKEKYDLGKMKFYDDND